MDRAHRRRLSGYIADIRDDSKDPDGDSQTMLVVRNDAAEAPPGRLASRIVPTSDRALRTPSAQTRFPLRSGPQPIQDLHTIDTRIVCMFLCLPDEPLALRGIFPGRHRRAHGLAGARNCRRALRDRIGGLVKDCSPVEVALTQRLISFPEQADSEIRDLETLKPLA